MLDQSEFGKVNGAQSTNGCAEDLQGTRPSRIGQDAGLVTMTGFGFLSPSPPSPCIPTLVRSHRPRPVIVRAMHCISRHCGAAHTKLRPTLCAQPRTSTKPLTSACCGRMGVQERRLLHHSSSQSLAAVNGPLMIVKCSIARGPRYEPSAHPEAWSQHFRRGDVARDR
ncbi:hypothetical protein BD413DRAFT_203021 [Trametes elegans]|nr:hypothetical protein BD413DRAFT_203021 [Trametes elegans]